MYQYQNFEQIIEKMYNGECPVTPEVRRMIKLLQNAHGTDINQLKDYMKGLVEVSTMKAEINGKEYISVDTVIDIIENV